MLKLCARVLTAGSLLVGALSADASTQQRRMARRSSALIAVDAVGEVHQIGSKEDRSTQTDWQQLAEGAELEGNLSIDPNAGLDAMLNPIPHAGDASGVGRSKVPSARPADGSVTVFEGLARKQKQEETWEKVGSAEVVAPPDGELQPAIEGNLKEPPEPTYMKALEGLGVSAFARSPAGSQSLDRELRSRLEVQDASALVFLAAGLGATVLVTCFSVYTGASDGSTALFYTEPTHAQPRMLCSSNEVEDFLQSFNEQPKSASLRIVGFPVAPSRGFVLSRLCALVDICLGVPRPEECPEFDVALDLSPFIASTGSLSLEDESLLGRLLQSENPLLEIVLRKKVQWTVWEDVATNIRQRLRSLGFEGSMEISLESREEVVVFRNHRWSNFVRNPVTHALAVLSVVGIFLWKPYVWMRTERVKVDAMFTIVMEPDRYWEMVSSGLDRTEGFIAM
mmetsp:Transcript_44941/g.82079  ORF Transcript_44941/g.82079 Transcript_44941/m.82079 type:complete len:453 (+) Transcript_44941:149-1507(+)